MLMTEKETKSKLNSIQYKNLQIQEYLVSGKFNLRKKKLLFKIRTRMLNTADNFGLKVPCRLCQLDTDSISHVLQCVLVKLQVPQILINSDISLDDAFKINLDRMETLASVFEKAWRKREEMLEEENYEHLTLLRAGQVKF